MWPPNRVENADTSVDENRGHWCPDQEYFHQGHSFIVKVTPSFQSCGVNSAGQPGTSGSRVEGGKNGVLGSALEEVAKPAAGHQAAGEVLCLGSGKKS